MDCFRPVGLTWDSKDRLWMSSDTTGEIYVLMKREGDSREEWSTIVTDDGENGAHAGRWEGVRALVIAGVAATLVAGLLSF